jgi:hypothetical protein
LAGGVAQGVAPEFNIPSTTKKKKLKSKIKLKFSHHLQPSNSLSGAMKKSTKVYFCALN